MAETKKRLGKMGYGFGTAPVFLTSICSIIGAILFLRFGFAVGNVGLINALIIILLGHAITIPTGLAISEIATNLRVGGGGEYFIINRSFGARIGATIGVMLYAAQTISIAFYIIGFSEGLGPFIPTIQKGLDLLPLSITYDPRMVTIPVALIMFSIMLTKGANIGIKLLWVVFGAIMASILLFMVSPPMSGAPSGITEQAVGSKNFLTVFTIVFPAFTGLTAGVGLSGDLKDPGRSIPRGVIFASFLGFVVYIAMVIKLYLSAPVGDLASNNLIIYDLVNGLGNLHLGVIIIIGIFSATISSAIGFTLIAPRTLQALGKDKVFYAKWLTNFFKEGRGKKNEPTNATLVSAIVAMVFVFIGNLNTVAQIITMFFLITYGSICMISFLEHFVGNPSYRPTFKTKWYFSLLGAVMSFGIMFQFSPVIAILTLLIMGGIYFTLGYRHKRSRSFSIIFQGAMFQLSRFIKINLQRTMSKPDKFNWRPSLVAISTNAVERKAPKDVLRWISHHYGFGTLVHLIKGNLDPETIKTSRKDENTLIKEMRTSKANYSIGTLVSPSMVSAVAQMVQISGISGLDNNTILFEFHKNRSRDLREIVDAIWLSRVADYNNLVLRSTEHDFGSRKTIHVWIGKDDFKNINLMILLSYIIMEHKDWRGADIKIYTLFSRGEKAVLAKRIRSLISKGRIPISSRSVHSKVYESEKDIEGIIRKHSSKADLTLFGFTFEQIKEQGGRVFTRYDMKNEVLFVNAAQDLVIN